MFVADIPEKLVTRLGDILTLLSEREVRLASIADTSSAVISDDVLRNNIRCLP